MVNLCVIAWSRRKQKYNSVIKIGGKQGDKLILATEKIVESNLSLSRIKMKKPVIFSILLLLFFQAARAQEVITLEKALDSAMANNLQIKQAQFQESLAEKDVLQSKMDLYPSANAGSSASWNWGTFFDQSTGRLITTSGNSVGASFSVSAPLFRGFQRLNQIAANKYLLLSDKSYTEKIKNDLQLAVVTTYMEALTNHDLLEASHQQLKLSREQLSVEQANFDVGNRTLADLSQAKSQVATDELNVTSSGNAYELSILNLKQLMEMDPSTDITLEKPELPEVGEIASVYDAGTVFSNAVRSFPEIRQAEYNRLAAEKNIDIARGGYYPTLSLSGGLSTVYSSSNENLMTGKPFSLSKQFHDNFSQSLGITLNIPIFNNLRTRIGVSKAKISYQNALIAEQQTKNELNKIINQAVLDLRAAEKQYRSSEQAFISMQEAFNVIKQRYEVGLANSIELSTSQTNMNKAEFDLITAKYNIIFRRKVIDFYLGKPINFN